MKASACYRSRAGFASVSVLVVLTMATTVAIGSQHPQCGDASWNSIGRRLSVLCDHRLLRHLADGAVMVFQVVGVLALGMRKVFRPGVWSRGAGRAVVGAEIGMGFAGLVCAGNYSAFALFAGATLVMLFLADLGDDANKVAHSAGPAASQKQALGTNGKGGSSRAIPSPVIRITAGTPAERSHCGTQRSPLCRRRTARSE